MFMIRQTNHYGGGRSLLSSSLAGLLGGWLLGLGGLLGSGLLGWLWLGDFLGGLLGWSLWGGFLGSYNIKVGKLI